jgi:hypothetical protein
MERDIPVIVPPFAIFYRTPLDWAPDIEATGHDASSCIAFGKGAARIDSIRRQDKLSAPCDPDSWIAYHLCAGVSDSLVTGARQEDT